MCNFRIFYNSAIKKKKSIQATISMFDVFISFTSYLNMRNEWKFLRRDGYMECRPFQLKIIRSLTLLLNSKHSWTNKSFDFIRLKFPCNTWDLRASEQTIYFFNNIWPIYDMKMNENKKKYRKRQRYTWSKSKLYVFKHYVLFISTVTTGVIKKKRYY